MHLSDASAEPPPRHPPDAPSSLETGLQVIPLRRQILDIMPALRKYARKLGKNEHDESDLVHEAVTRALEHFKHGNLAAWCSTVMYRCWMDELRHRNRERTSADINAVIELHASQSPNQEHAIRAIELERALHILNKDQRDALLALRYHGYTQEEAAASCGVTKNVIAGRAFRAEVKLRSLLD